MMRPSQSTTMWSSSNQSCPICTVVHKTRSRPSAGSAQIRGELNRRRPSHSVHAERHRRGHVAAQQREEHVRRNAFRAHPVFDDGRAAVGARRECRQRRPDVATVRQMHDVFHRMPRTDRFESRRWLRLHQRDHRIDRQQWRHVVLGVANRHRRADGSSIALVQLDVDEADPPPALTHGGHHPHRSGVRGPQEIARDCDR